MTSDPQQEPTAKLTTPTDREIHVERVFEAPRDRVFAVYTDPELIPEWWGPRDTTTVVDRMEVRSGGSWRFLVRNSDHSETGFRGTYREVTPPERIVQTFEWEGMPGHVSVETVVLRSRRPHEGDDHVHLPHPRGTRRHARLGHAARDERNLRSPGRGARWDRLSLTGHAQSLTATRHLSGGSVDSRAASGRGFWVPQMASPWRRRVLGNRRLGGASDCRLAA